MRDVAFEHVGDGFDAPVGVPGEALDVLVRVVRTEIVQHQEWVEKRGFPAAEHPAQGHARALDHLLAMVDVSYLSSHHISFGPAAGS